MFDSNTKGRRIGKTLVERLDGPGRKDGESSLKIGRRRTHQLGEVGSWKGWFGKEGRSESGGMKMEED
jgi:hypothetical protein